MENFQVYTKRQLGHGLEVEEGDAQCEQEGLEEGIDWLEDGDVLHEHAVPQEAHEKGHQTDPDKQDDEVVQELLTGTRIQQALHFILINDYYLPLFWPAPA